MSPFSLADRFALPDRIPQLFMSLIGAAKCPAVPLCGALELIDTLGRLAGREDQAAAAKQGLTNTYTIGGTTARAIQFLYGSGMKSGAYDDLKLILQTDPASVLNLLTGQERSALGRPATPPQDALTNRSLESADQWAMSWTNYAGVYERAAAPPPDGPLAGFAGALDPGAPAAASRAFWPTIATYGLGYNLLILEKVGGARLADLKALFGPAWAASWDAAAAGGLLYAIDMRLFESLPPDAADVRFTPATVTLLTQDAHTKDLRAVAVRVTGQSGRDPQTFVEASPAWLYGLMAARTSVTVWGVWLGHVYHWHMVTAAMLLAAQKELPGGGGATPPHPIRQLLDPQSKYLVPFDLALLLLWSDIAPPTSVDTGWGFLRLMSQYATGRGYFDDDPLATLARNGIAAADFSTDTAGTNWAKYPIAATYLRVWDATASYVAAFVDASYPTGSPGADAALQKWLAAAADPSVGNVPGLPPQVTTNDQLTRLLTSLVYRVTMHGSARLLSAANPGLTFVANFPPCLQQLTIPAPAAPLTAKDLFAYLPRTGTIGSMLRFYDIFSFSRPYEPFVPAYGLESNLFFPNGTADARNRALVQYRVAIQGLIDTLSPVSPPPQSQRYQWPLCIET